MELHHLPVLFIRKLWRLYTISLSKNTRLVFDSELLGRIGPDSSHLEVGTVQVRTYVPVSTNGSQLRRLNVDALSIIPPFLSSLIQLLRNLLVDSDNDIGLVGPQTQEREGSGKRT